MTTDGFNASIGSQGGQAFLRKVFASALIVALLATAFAATSVLAAPARQGEGPGEDNDSGAVTQNQMRELREAQAWFNNFHTQPGQGNSAKVSQYLGMYAFALSQANAVLSGGTANAEGQDNNQSRNNFSARQNMGMWLHMMRGLRGKIAEAGAGTIGNNNAGNNGAGIPVTGGSETNAAPGTSADPNATPGTSTDQNAIPNTGNDQSAVQGTSLAQTWGNQWRELQEAQAWFNNYRSKPGQNRNSEKISQYLDRYAFALSQANAIIAGGIDAKADQQNNSLDQGLTNSQSDRTAAQQQLAWYLHMMRGLRAKISAGGNDNDNGNGGSSTTP